MNASQMDFNIAMNTHMTHIHEFISQYLKEHPEATNKDMAVFDAEVLDYRLKDSIVGRFALWMDTVQGPQRFRQIYSRKYVVDMRGRMKEPKEITIEVVSSKRNDRIIVKEKEDV